MYIRILCSLLIGLFLAPTPSFGYDERYVHPAINGIAAEGSQLDQVMMNQLSFFGGSKAIFDGKSAQKLIEEGGKLEDAFPRWLKHFHDPLKPWSQAGLDMLLDPFSPHKSSVVWAQDSAENESSWGEAKNHYYLALTTGSELEYAHTFRALGQVMHLIADSSVPAHVRNDSHPEGDTYEAWAANKEENYLNSLTVTAYARRNFDRINFTGYTVDPSIFSHAVSSGADHDTAPLAISALWDQNRFTGNNAQDTWVGEIGLAEFTNANFFSRDTIFSYDSPSKWDTNYHEIDWLHPEAIDAEDGKKDNKIYIYKKVGVGQAAPYRLASISYLTNDLMSDPDYYEFDHLGFDDAVLSDYSAQLVPRAVGYASALLDYFFRGSLEITQPYSGGYALVLNREDKITRIKLRARNTSPAGEEMTGGSLDLVVRYRILQGDPFQNTPAQRSENIYYSVFTLAGGATAVPADTPVELVFDLASGSEAIPLTATDVFLQLIYRGQLGQEADGVAVGMKDIGEPTPVDFINYTHQVCLYGNWYESGSAEAVSLVDKDGNGVADPYCSSNGSDCESDVYPHNIRDIYVGVYPMDRPGTPSAADHDVYFDIIPPAGSKRFFVLTDYDFIVNAGQVHNLEHTSPADDWYGSYYRDTQGLTHAIRNQQGWTTDESICASAGLPAPCEVISYPLFYDIDGLLVTSGIVLMNSSYPDGTTCPALWGN